jgi:hypothetical protein
VPEPQAVSVAHAQGALWVTADLGEVWGEEHMTNLMRRAGLYSNSTGTQEVVELEPLDRVHIREYAALGDDRAPGGQYCRYVTVVLGDREQAQTIAAKLDAFESAGDVVPLELFVGELDGARELVLGVGTSSVADAELGLPKLLEHLGVPTAKVDCRPRELVEMIADLHVLEGD